MTKENKKLIAKLTALAILAGGVSYETTEIKKSLKVNDTLQNVVESFDEDTKLDEAAAEGLATYKNMSIIEAADKLESYIDIVTQLKSYNFQEVKKLDNLTKEEYKFADSLTEEDVFLLMEAANSTNDSLTSQEARLKAIKMLDYINTKDKEWIENNGRDLAMELLSWVVKSTVAENLNLPINEIDNIEIPPAKKIFDMRFYVTYNNQKYNISKREANIFDALCHYYQINSVEDFGTNEYDVYKDAIYYAKTTTMTGISEQNYVLQNKRSLKEAKKILKKD